jgi:hypothetical protein
MSIDINTLTSELSNLLAGIYRLERYLYDMYLDNVPKDVAIQYKNLNGGTTSVTIENIAKIKAKFDDIQNTLLSKSSYINILKDINFSSFSTYWTMYGSLSHTVSVEALSTTDKYQISSIIGEDIFTPPNATNVTNKLVIQISSPANRGDLRLMQSAAVIGLSAWHPKSFNIHAFVNPNGAGWTTNCDPYVPDDIATDYPFQLMFGDMSTFEIYFPSMYPTYNKGLVPAL